MSGAELAKLIYRDNVTIKHASRKRLADEMIQKSLAVPVPLEGCNVKQPGAGGPLTRALKNYLIFVLWSHLIS